MTCICGHDIVNHDIDGACLVCGDDCTGYEDPEAEIDPFWDLGVDDEFSDENGAGE